MNRLDNFADLAGEVGRQQPPRVDVAAGVLADIVASGPRPAGRPYWPAAAASAAVVAAVAVGALAVHTWLNWQEPLAEMFGPLTVVMR